MFKNLLLIILIFCNPVIAGELIPPPSLINPSNNSIGSPTINSVTESNIVKQCQNLPQTIEVDADFPNVQYAYDYSLAELNATHNKIGTDIAGLTYVAAYMETDNLYPQVQIGNLFCMKPTLKYTIGFKQIIVFIAHEFTTDECEFNFVLTHEMGHVKINYNYIQLAQKQYQDYLNETFKDKFFIGTKEEIEQEIVLLNSFKERITDNYSILEQEQKNFDSPEEYAKANTACGGSLIEKINSFNQSKITSEPNPN